MKNAPQSHQSVAQHFYLLFGIIVHRLIYFELSTFQQTRLFTWTSLCRKEKLIKREEIDILDGASVLEHTSSTQWTVCANMSELTVIFSGVRLAEIPKMPHSVFQRSLSIQVYGNYPAFSFSPYLMETCLFILRSAKQRHTSKAQQRSIAHWYLHWEYAND